MPGQRGACSQHGTRLVKLPWAEPSSRFTRLFEGLAIEWLRQTSQSAVARQLRLSWDEIHHIMERAVIRGRQRRKAEPLPTLGVDEKAFRRGHHYFTFVTDLAERRVAATICWGLNNGRQYRGRLQHRRRRVDES
jgi:transposase